MSANMLKRHSQFDCVGGREMHRINDYDYEWLTKKNGNVCQYYTSM